jgi:hypothetical protein
MIGYALGLLVAWGYDSGWEPVRRLAPSFLRSMTSAAVAGGVGWVLGNAIVGEGPVSILDGLLVMVVAGATTLALFLGISRLLGSTELREVLSR